jgi:hypothetical protein
MATNATRYRHFTSAATSKPAKIIEFGLRRAQVFFPAAAALLLSLPFGFFKNCTDSSLCIIALLIRRRARVLFFSKRMIKIRAFFPPPYLRTCLLRNGVWIGVCC